MATSEVGLAEPRSHQLLWRRYLELTKPKVLALILFTALVGMLLAVPGMVPLSTLFFGLLGIELSAAAGAAINHVVDQRVDALMDRTRERPLPSGDLDTRHAVAFALGLAVISMLILVVLVNPLTALLTFAAFIGYAVIYTMYLKRATGATAYVTLEPCCHQGRTPPCTDALLGAGVRRVVAAMADPNPLVAGRGLENLKAAGVALRVGVLEAEARALNPGFIKRMRRGLPFVRCKLAASLDGRTAMTDGESKWITSAAARRDVQFLRARSSAILTGSGTLLADDPILNVRLTAEELPGLEPGEPVRQPLRVLVDSRLRTPTNARLLGQPGGATLIAGLEPTSTAGRRLEAAGAEIYPCAGRAGRVDLESLLRYLARREINEVQVEAGPTLSGALLRAGLVDELVLYLAPHLMGDTARGLFWLPGLTHMRDRIGLDIRDLRLVGPDLRITAIPLATKNPR